jgi:hypothetical protein
VLSRAQELREEDEENDPPRRVGVGARPAARAEGDDEQGVELAPHPP